MLYKQEVCFNPQDLLIIYAGKLALQLESTWLDIHNPFYFCDVKYLQVKQNIQKGKM